MIFYVLRIWLIANLIHPVLLTLGCFLMFKMDYDDFSNIEPIVIVMMTLFGFLLTIPLQWIARLILNLIVRLEATNELKLVLWILTTPALLFFIVLALELCFFEINDFWFMVVIPGMLSSSIAILTQVKKFNALLADENSNYSIEEL